MRALVRCRAIAVMLPSVLDEAIALPAVAQRHLDQCLRCQVDVAQYRRIRNGLRASRSATHQPDPFLLGDILAALRPPAPVRALGGADQRHDRRRALVGGLAALATAGAAGVFVLVSRLGTRQGLAT